MFMSDAKDVPGGGRMQAWSLMSDEIGMDDNLRDLASAHCELRSISTLRFGRRRNRRLCVALSGDLAGACVRGLKIWSLRQ